MFKILGKGSAAARLRVEPPTSFNLKQQQDRAADELLGICRGMLFEEGA